MIATLEPAVVPDGAALKALLRRHRPDPAWAAEVAELRAELVAEERY